MDVFVRDLAHRRHPPGERLVGGHPRARAQPRDRDLARRQSGALRTRRRRTSCPATETASPTSSCATSPAARRARVDLGPGGIEPQGVQPHFPGCCAPFGLDMSPDGRFVLFAGGRPEPARGRCCLGIFLRDLRSCARRTTIAVATTSSPRRPRGCPTAAGSSPTALGGLDFTDFPGKTFVLDRRTGTRTRIGASVGDGSIVADIAGGGRYVLFTSYALGTPDSEVFLFDRTASTTTHMNVSAAALYTTRTHAVPCRRTAASSPSSPPTAATSAATRMASPTCSGATLSPPPPPGGASRRPAHSSCAARAAARCRRPAGSIVFVTGAAAVAGDTNAACDVLSPGAEPGHGVLDAGLRRRRGRAGCGRRGRRRRARARAGCRSVATCAWPRSSASSEASSSTRFDRGVNGMPPGDGLARAGAPRPPARARRRASPRAPRAPAPRRSRARAAGRAAGARCRCGRARARPPPPGRSRRPSATAR